MANTDTLQYLLLGLASGMKSYTERRNELQDMDRRYGTPEERQQHQQLQDELLRQQIQSTGALTEERRATADWQSRRESPTPRGPRPTDAYETALDNIPIAHRMAVSQMASEMMGPEQDYEGAIQKASDKLANVDKEFPISQPKDDMDFSFDKDKQRLEIKLREQARTQRAMNLGFLHRLKDIGYRGQGAAPPMTPAGAGQGIPGSPLSGPAAAQVPGSMPPQGGAPSPFQPGGSVGVANQPPAPQPGAPPSGPLGRGALSPEPMGGARFTPPRMPTPQIAQQNFQAFSQAPQNGATLGDRRRAGELAELWTYAMDKTTPFPMQAQAWFKLNELAGVPIPHVFLTWATGQGVPRSVIDQYRNRGRMGQAMQKRNEMQDEAQSYRPR